MTASLRQLDPLPRLGWIDAPSPCTPVSIPGFAGRLVIKRDDLIATHHGSSKVRKLDCLLAAEPWASAERWASFGAIGSGHLTALTAAAETLGRGLDAYMFWEPPDAHILGNLAFTATGPTRIRFRATRVGVALRFPRILAARTTAGAVVIPPGATCATGTLGFVRAGLELADQIAHGDIARPHRVYIALGSAGSAAGLAVGLGLAGLPIEVHAVATVERVFVPNARVRAVTEAVVAELRRVGVSLPAGFTPAPLRVRRGWVGPGYGRASAASRAATTALRAADIPAEPVYTGKAFACLLADGPSLDDTDVLFWMTARSAAPTDDERHPATADEGNEWRAPLPTALARRLDPVRFRRRQLLTATLTGAAGATLGFRLVGYRAVTGPWSGSVLSAREAAIVAAASQALAGIDDTGALPGGVAPWEVAIRVDAYLATLPRRTRRDVHAMLTLVEQGTPLGLDVRRLTRMPVVARRRTLMRVASAGGLLAVAVRGLRDLCLLGIWQTPRTWPDIGYEGPSVPEAGRGETTPLARWVADRGALPQAAEAR